MAHLSDDALDDLAAFAREGRIGADLPVIVRLDAPQHVYLGESLTIQWQVERGREITLSVTGNGIHRLEQVPSAGSIVLADLPLGTFRVELVALSGNGATTRTTAVSVRAHPPRLTVTLDSPTVVLGEKPARACWTSANAQYLEVEFDGRKDLHPLVGSAALSPAKAGRYRLAVTAYGAGGAVTEERDIEAVAPPLRIEFQAPMAVGHGEAIEVDWAVTGATRLELHVDSEPFGKVPCAARMEIQALHRAMALRLVATGWDGASHSRTLRLVPRLLVHTVGSLPLPAIAGRAPFDYAMDERAQDCAASRGERSQVQYGSHS